MRKLFTHTDTTVREVKLGNGSTTVFNLAMEFFENADLVINLVVIATGVKILQVITTDYTLSGGNGASGTVTMNVAPPATDNLVIERKQPGTQAIDYEPNSPVPAETIEEGLDRSAMLANQAKEVGDRSIVFPIDEVLAAGDGELPVLAVRKDKVLSFNTTTGKPETITTVAAINAAAVDAAAAAVSATNAATSETNAVTSETNAATSETNAAIAQTAAELAETNAAASAADAIVNAAGFRYNFDDTTAMSDPGSGDIRFNNATLANVTALALDALAADAGSPDVSAFVALWGSSTTLLKRGTITIRKIGTPATFVTFDIDAVVVDNTGWLEVPVAHVASNGTFTAADKLIVHFTRTGDKGDGDVIGPVSSTNNAVARFDLATGKLLQNSVVTVSDTGAVAGVSNISLSGTVDGRNVATDGTKLDGVSSGAEVNAPPISQVDAEAGTATIEQMFTAQRVAQAIAALESGGASGLVSISNTAITAVTNINVTGFLPSTYDNYEVWLSNGLPANDGVILEMETSTDGGSSFDVGASDYTWAVTFVNEAGVPTNGGDADDTEIQLGGILTSGNVVDQEGISLKLSVFEPETTRFTGFACSGVLRDQTTILYHFTSSSQRQSTADVDGLRFHWSAGDWAAQGAIQFLGIAQ